jgi:2-polyprenyl-3-methyl-5-hydroxy-6-metoxy-1,4-benzoquinol methylase
LSCCAINGIDEMFDDSNAAKELKKYQNRGVTGTTKILVNFFETADLGGKTLLDIGGGVGIIQHELIKNGITKAISVEASTAYNKASKVEAKARGHTNSIKYIEGDFVTSSIDVPDVDIVTLERVICCYPNMKDLVSKSLDHTKEFYGIVYPRGNIILKIGTSLLNLYQKISGKEYRSYVHSQKEFYEITKEKGFNKILGKKRGIWIVEIFRRDAT